jgi:hypothetical protein
MAPFSPQITIVRGISRLEGAEAGDPNQDDSCDSQETRGASCAALDGRKAVVKESNKPVSPECSNLSRNVWLVNEDQGSSVPGQHMIPLGAAAWNVLSAFPSRFVGRHIMGRVTSAKLIFRSFFPFHPNVSKLVPRREVCWARIRLLCATRSERDAPQQIAPKVLPVPVSVA